MTRDRVPHLERLSAADASNVVLDAPDQVNAFLLAGLLGPGGPVRSDGTVDLAAARNAVGDWGRVERRLGQRVVRRAGRLWWQPVVPDPDRHLWTVERVRGVDGLEDLCARLVVEPLPPDRRPWELVLVPGVLPGRCGLMLRIHHALADGTATVRLLERLLGPAGPATHRPIPASGPPRRSTLASSVSRTASVFRGSGHSRLLGHLGPRRGVAFLETPLGRLVAAAHHRSATVNDVLLAAVAAAAADLLRAVGEPPTRPLRASVPVALPHQVGSGNAVGVMLVRLPTEVTDPDQRVAEVAARTRQAKDDARRRGTFELTRSRLGSAVFRRLARHQHLVHVFVTNVPGPTTSLSLAGAPLVRAWAVAPLQGNVRLGVSATSYGGVLAVGVQYDRALPGRVFVDRLRRELVG